MVFAVNRSHSLPGLIYQALRSSICHGNTISLDFHVYILAAWSQFARELRSGVSKSLFLKLRRSRPLVMCSKEPDWWSIGKKLGGGSDVLCRWILVCSNVYAEWLCISLWGSTVVFCVCVCVCVCVCSFSDTNAAEVTNTCSPSFTYALSVTLYVRFSTITQRKLCIVLVKCSIARHTERYLVLHIYFSSPAHRKLCVRFPTQRR